MTTPLGLHTLDCHGVEHAAVNRIAVRFRIGVRAGCLQLNDQSGRCRPIARRPLAPPAVYMTDGAGRGVEQRSEAAARDTRCAGGRPPGVEHRLTESELCGFGVLDRGGATPGLSAQPDEARCAEPDQAPKAAPHGSKD